MSTETAILGVIIVLLILIAGILVALLRKPQTAPRMISLAPGMDEVIERLNRSIEHHIDVNAVVGMIRVLDQHPGAIEQLQDYPGTVRAAAMLHYINTLGSDLQVAQKHLSDMHRIHRSAENSPNTKQAQAHVDALRAKLDAAIAASGQKMGPRAV